MLFCFSIGVKMESYTFVSNTYESYPLGKFHGYVINAVVAVADDVSMIGKIFAISTLGFSD